ncbi:hypothetical protein Y032_0022g632 [Ancylostoma ceylanicum]|uniref:Uncharacterized protein n=1 Tax=Ancylostoma ceylanicum TaxID=53326 RepID=A0A016V142_9BILA|nr:hypothetical protein Y032_0022g632 [Ancylostoma ceylanicum]
MKLISAQQMAQKALRCLSSASRLSEWMIWFRLNGTMNLPLYQFQGTVGQCDGVGQPSAMLKNIFGFSCWVR